MSKVMLEFDSKQIAAIVETLPIKEKLLIAHRLNAETWQIRFKNLTSKIDHRLKNRRKPSAQQVVQLVKKIRKGGYAH